jgi:hypothetical protein
MRLLLALARLPSAAAIPRRAASAAAAAPGPALAPRATRVRAPLGAAAAALRALDARGVAAWARSSGGVDARHAEVLLKEEVDGAALLALTADQLRGFGLPGGPASALARAVEAALAVELVVYPPPGKGAARNPVSMIMTPERFHKVFPADAPLLLVRDGTAMRRLFTLEEALAAIDEADEADAAAAAAVKAAMATEASKAAEASEAAEAARAGAAAAPRGAAGVGRAHASRARLCFSRSFDGEVAGLRGFVKSVSTALELATTRALARNEGLAGALGGRLVAVNAGELVHLTLAVRSRPAVQLEADGLVAAPGAGVLLLNSVKVSPADEDLDALLADADTLQRMLGSLDAVTTQPPGAKEQLRGLLRVAPVLSGANFSARVEAACLASGVGSARPDGEGFAVTLPAL